uniref:Ataxin 7 like 1 n=1 Tax=Felis catus TaxID=9685 RepID=A0ABI7XG97_FELCA
MTSERSRIPCLSAAAAEGTGKKQQEGRAMATLDRKVPSPEAFLGKPWSSWIDAAKLHCSDNVDLEEAGKEGGKSREVMRLNKEDMHLFGHYPAHDDFYLVVCGACNQAVKPQVFQAHCGMCCCCGHWDMPANKTDENPISHQNLPWELNPLAESLMEGTRKGPRTPLCPAEFCPRQGRPQLAGEGSL